MTLEAHRQHKVRYRSGAKVDGVHSAARERERLHEIVVGAEIEPLHAILDGVFRRQHQHRRLQPAPAQRGQHFEAVALRQHQIEQHEVVRLLAHEKKPSSPVAATSTS